MAIRKYGAAYQGSKSKIADEIISLLPSKKYFIDAFSGGGALAHCALESKKFEHIIANDIQTKDILEAHFLWTPKQHLEFQKKWITKEEFEQTNNLYIKTCWSFSNNRKAYIYSKACYEYKRRLHNAICFGNYKEFEDYCGIDLSEIDSYEVFVCEYNIENPAFEEIWSKEVINTGGGNRNQKRSVEKLYHVK